MKALIGACEQRPTALLAELTALRSRVRDLERDVAELRAENDRLRLDSELAADQSARLRHLPPHDAAAGEGATSDDEPSEMALQAS